MSYSFYNEKGEYYTSYYANKAISHGCNGYIYQIDNNTLLKRFILEYPNELTFKTIMNMNLSNFYTIYQMLYDKDGKFIGYTMKYYQDEEIDILTKPIEYTLDNLYRLNNSIKKLTDRNIIIDDMRDENCILDSSNITVIDIDLYRMLSFDTNIDISNMNNKSLLYLFRGLYYRSLVIYHDAIRSDRHIIDSLFDQDNNADDITKRLVKYKYPIDYINDKRRKYYGHKTF